MKTNGPFSLVSASGNRMRPGKDATAPPRPDGIPGPVDALAAEIIEALARQFPVCMASDEFHYFPQARSGRHDYSRWDDFSGPGLERMARRLSGWEDHLAGLTRAAPPAPDPDPDPDPDTEVDIAMLFRTLRTLREQLTLVRCHETQPTYPLTIAAIGMAEALEAGSEAFRARLETLPAFLQEARRSLVRAPASFRDLGIEMTKNLRAWLASVDHRQEGLPTADRALGAFQDHLSDIPVADGFRLPEDLLDRTVRHHIGCGTGVDGAYAELESERDEMADALEREARRMGPDRSWQAVLEGMPSPPLPDGGQGALYRAAIKGLGRHCVDAGIIDASLLDACPVRVTPIPDYLSTIRSTAAYSMPPGHPPRGGTFYVDDRFNPDHLPQDYRLLTAHETYAGHHLLDTARWGLARRLRRHIEYPLFYEGWACFSEKLLFHTGFFTGAADRLLLAKRRYWRALRGLADLDIQTGRKNPPQAAASLAASGMPRDQAVAMVRRYALKPGYQLCYAIGMRWFERIYSAWRRRGGNPAGFARLVFATGEIGLANLEKMVCHHVEIR